MCMNVTDPHSIGEAIRRERKAHNLTQAELAKSAGIAVNSVRLYESGKRIPDILQAAKIADALWIPLDAILPMTAGRYILRAMQQKRISPSNLSNLTSIDIEKLNAILRSDHVKITPDEKKALNDVLGIDIDVFTMMGLETYAETAASSMSSEILTAFDRLNETGQHKAIERVQELGRIPEYRKTPEQD